MTLNDRYDIASQVRDECIRTAVSAYENASMVGLCGEGAFEAAVSAMRMLDVREFVETSAPEDAGDA